MANTKSALKQWRVSLRKRARNRPVRSAVRTFLSKAVAAIAAGQREPAAEAVKGAIQTLDKAAEKKVIHPNNAARRKSRLMKRLNAFLQAEAAREAAAQAEARARPSRRRSTGTRATRAGSSSTAARAVPSQEAT